MQRLFIQIQTKSLFKGSHVHIEMTHMKLKFQSTECQFSIKERYMMKDHLRNVHKVAMEDTEVKTLIYNVVSAMSNFLKKTPNLM